MALVAAEKYARRRCTPEIADSTDDAWVSFDGSTDAAHMVPGTPDQRLVFNQRVTKVWLKRGAAGAAPTNVQVMAEAY